VSEKYAFVDAEYATPAGDEGCAPGVTQMCEWLEISKSGYYDWKTRPESEAAQRRELLKIKIKALIVAVGTAIAGGPPRRSQRAGLPHWAPVMGIWRRTALRARGA
jgi:hypothetical protein